MGGPVRLQQCDAKSAVQERLKSAMHGRRIWMPTVPLHRRKIHRRQAADEDLEVSPRQIPEKQRAVSAS